MCLNVICHTYDLSSIRVILEHSSPLATLHCFITEGQNMTFHCLKTSNLGCVWLHCTYIVPKSKCWDGSNIKYSNIKFHENSMCLKANAEMVQISNIQISNFMKIRPVEVELFNVPKSKCWDGSNIKYSNIKFHENSSSGSRVVQCA